MATRSPKEGSALPRAVKRVLHNWLRGKKECGVLGFSGTPGVY